MTETMHENLHQKEAARDYFRDCVLAAMDAAAKDIFKAEQAGPTDGDLPALFRAVDAQFELLASRAVTRLYTPEELSEMYWSSQGDAAYGEPGLGLGRVEPLLDRG